MGGWRQGKRIETAPRRRRFSTLVGATSVRWYRVSVPRWQVGIARRRYTPPTGGGVRVLNPRKRPLSPTGLPVAVRIPIRSNNHSGKPSVLPTSPFPPSPFDPFLSLYILSLFIPLWHSSRWRNSSGNHSRRLSAHVPTISQFSERNKTNNC